jgi:Domain of unknown function (DUF4440)
MSKPSSPPSGCNFPPPAFVSVVVFCSLLGCAGPPTHPTWSNATGAEQHERLMWQAIKSKDWTNFERQIAPAFVGVDSTGKAFDRAAWVEYWKQTAINDYSLGEVAVQPGGPDLVVTYLITLAGGGPANSAAPRRVRVVSVWQQVKSRLILTACSMTPLQGG